MKMKAAVVNEFGKPISIEEVTIEPPGEGEVRVRVAAVGVCHTDLHGVKGEHGSSELPAIFGHEVSGFVDEVGKNVTYVKPGDRVLISLMKAGCGECFYCQVGQAVHCVKNKIRRVRPETGGLAGPSRCLNKDGMRLWQLTGTYAGFAEYTIVREEHLCKVDPDIPMETAAVLSCAVISGFGATINRSQIKPFESAVIVGTGGVGLSAIQGAAFCGAHPVIAVDILDSKLEAARSFGATHTINSAKVDPIQAVMELTDGRGADHVLMTVAGIKLKRVGFAMLSVRGRMVMIGHAGREYMNEFEVTEFMGGRSIFGSAMGGINLRVDISRMLDLYRTGRLKIDKMITGRYSLEQINEAFASTEKGDVLRNVVLL